MAVDPVLTHSAESNHAGAPPFKRRNYFINPKFQLRFLVFISIVTTTCMAVLHCSNLYFFWRFRKLGSDFGMAPDHVFFQFINEQQVFMDQIFFGTALVAFAAIIMAGVLFSHRIAGPLFRLKKHMHQISEGGPLEELTFRKKDYFQEIPGEFNAMLKRFKDR